MYIHAFWVWGGLGSGFWVLGLGGQDAVPRALLLTPVSAFLFAPDFHGALRLSSLAPASRAAWKLALAATRYLIAWVISERILGLAPFTLVAFAHLRSCASGARPAQEAHVPSVRSSCRWPAVWPARAVWPAARRVPVLHAVVLAVHQRVVLDAMQWPRVPWT